MKDIKCIAAFGDGCGGGFAVRRNDLQLPTLGSAQGGSAVGKVGLDGEE